MSPQAILDDVRKHFSLTKLQEYTANLNLLERKSSHCDFEKSSRYVFEELKKAGFQKVERITHKADGITTTYDCTMPQAWDQTGRSTLTIVKGNVPEHSRVLADTDLHPLHALVWSKPTPKGGITAELVNYDNLDPAHPDCKGKWVFYPHSNGSSFNGVVYQTLAKAGAAGIVVTGFSTLETAPTAIFWANGSGINGWYHTKGDLKMPGFAISPLRGQQLVKELEAGKIIVHGELNCKVYDGEIYTVTGIIPGESKEEYVLLSHLYEPFPSDDAIGFAIGCEFGRQLMERGIKPQKTIRVIFSMELYGFSAYLCQPAHRKNILAAMNLDSFNSYCSESTAFRSTPIFNSLFTDWFYTDWFKKYLPNLKWINEWGNLSDDTFGGDPKLNIPTNWIHTPCGIYHHNTDYYFNVNWLDTKQKAPVLFAAIEALLNAPIPDYSKRAASDFAADCKNILTNTRLKSNEKRIGIEAEWMRQNQNLDSQERFGAPKANRSALKKEYDAAQKKLAALPFQEMTAAEYKADNLIVTETSLGAPFSLARVPHKERGVHRISQNLWALFDGKRSLLEAVRILDAEQNRSRPKEFDIDSEEARAKAAAVRTPDSGLISIIENLKFVEKYGYCKLKYRHNTSAREFETALKKLGVRKGMQLITHCTFSSLGKTSDSPEKFCQVLQKMLTKEGTLLMPTFVFYLYEGKEFGEPFDVKKSPSCTGILSESLRKMPGVLRSYDPCHPYAVWGKDSRSFVENHHKGMTVGSTSPLALLEKKDGWCLTISAADSVTFMHVVEYSNHCVCLGNRTEEYTGILPNGKKVKLRTWGWRTNTCPHCPEHRTEEIFQYLRKHKFLKETMLGNAHLCLFKLRDYRKAYESLLKECCTAKSKARPRKVATTVPSDWDAKKGCLKKSTAYTGPYLG